MPKQSTYYISRYVAQVTLEATTPLKTASGKSDLFIDAPVRKDWNGLPMILGSSIAGVLRHSTDTALQNMIFGDDDSKKKDAEGSRIIISAAQLLDDQQKINYGLGAMSDSDPEFIRHYHNLPVREHVAIDHKGVAAKHGKFDEEIVYKGSRFKFEIEFLAEKDSKEDKKIWHDLLSRLNAPLFRLGGGSTKGFGEMRVVSCLEKVYTLGGDYCTKPSNLNVQKGEEKICASEQSATTYRIAIEPEDFFSFGAGFGDADVDSVPVVEKIVEWREGRGAFSNEQILMPASSLKGALSHRVAFHYNKDKRIHADEIPLEEFEQHVGSNNLAVRDLFGAKKGDAHEAKGKALFSDIFKTFDTQQVKVFDHVKIDRFTGGASDGALYNEKIIAQKDIWEIQIVLSDAISEDTKKAFEATLDDLCRGYLPLGGMAGRGHGVFVGVPSGDGGQGTKGWTKEVKGGENE